MKISRITLFRCERPFFIPFISSKALRTKTEAVILRIDCDDFIKGFGESTPRHYVTGESTETVSRVICEIMAGFLLEKTFASLEEIENLLTDLSLLCKKKYGHPFNSALGAVDLALLDAFGNYTGKEVVEFLGPVSREYLPYALSIPLFPTEELRGISAVLQNIPASSFKIVADKDSANVLNRVRFLREELGFEGEITIDANGIWSAEEACSILDRIKEFRIAGVEQPTCDIDGLKKVRDKTGIPVIADESVCSLSDTMRLVEHSACDGINIKISKCGGLIRSREIALYAHTQGLDCQIGAHVGETEILTAAGLALAKTVPHLLR
ncbi:MAG: hypothetical protein M0P57_15150, partial [Syntrophales bacterium]|nr:hypothetical protein [Syntrophales bacterium]